MKYCLNAYVDKPQLDKADELKVIWDKRDIVPEIFEQYPEKDIILECFEQNLSSKEWEDMKIYKGLGRGHFKVCCANWRMFKDHDIPFYVGYPITDMFTLLGLVRAGVTDVVVAGPIMFDLENVWKGIGEKVNVQIRVKPNVAYTDGLPHQDGVLGSWIRPQDVEAYGNLIDVLEFDDVQNKTREQALYRIYAEEKKWLGQLSDLITNLDYPGDNAYIPKDMAEHRIDCRQRCLFGSTCRICYRMLDLANVQVYDKIMEQKKEKENEQI